jgi:hypothetical protein
MSKRVGRPMLLAPWMALAACAGTPKPWEYPDPFPLEAQSILCGQELPARCNHQRLSFSELPSRAPAAADLGGSSGADSAERGSPQKRMTPRSQGIPEATFGLERIARGYYGDSLVTRQDTELRLAHLLKAYGDDGGAVDLTFLSVRAGEGAFVNQEWLVTLARRCPSARMLHTLTLVDEGDLWPRFDSSPDTDVALAQLNLLRARGFVERGNYREARRLFEYYRPRVPYALDFVQHCTAWLEGRDEEATSVPEWRACNCDIEPPKWREGCGC